MASLFASTRNTRSILPDSFRYIRSDVPEHITEEEIQWLIDHRVFTIIDLRMDEERKRRTCPLENHPSFRYLCMPVTGGDAIPVSADAVSKSYIRMGDSQMERIIEIIWNAGSNVMFFCNAGKDRTGVVAAILLTKLGINRQDIINDYLESGEKLKELLADFAAGNPKVDIRVITPASRYMEEFLDAFECK